MTELLGKDSLDRYLKNNRPGRRDVLYLKNSLVVVIRGHFR